MIKYIFRYTCPSCGKRKRHPIKGFLGASTACSDKCKTNLKRKAEQQFAIWRFEDYELKQLYFKVLDTLVFLDQDKKDLLYTDFIIWLYLKHGGYRAELARVYDGLMGVNNG